MRNSNQINQSSNDQAMVEKLPVWMKALFYLYLALLPLFAFWAMYLDKGMWQEFIYTGESTSAGKLLFIVFSFIAIFLSGIFALFIVQNTPIPKKILAAVFMMFDVPVQVAISSLTADQLNISQLIVVDFTIELAGMVLAMVYLSFIKKLDTDEDTRIAFILLLFFGLAILFSNYGAIGWQYVKSLSFSGQLPVYTAVITTLVMYVRSMTHKGKIDVGYLKEEQGKMSNFATISMIALWASMVLIIFL
jgi:hypothetical protein